MGYIKHYAIIVQGFDIIEAHTEIKNILIETFEDGRASDMVSNIVPNFINGSSSFFIGPDGSKEGWKESNLGDLARERIVGYLRGTNLDFVEVVFGGDDNLAEIIN